MSNPIINPDMDQEVYIKVYPVNDWDTSTGKPVHSGIKGYMPIQVTNSLMIEINKMISTEEAQNYVDDPKVAFSVVAKPKYIYHILDGLVVPILIGDNYFLLQYSYVLG